MARCEEVLKDALTGKILLKCDNRTRHTYHYDALQNVEWRQPTSRVRATRNERKPPKEERAWVDEQLLRVS